MSETKKVSRIEYFPDDEPSFKDKKNKIIEGLNELYSKLGKLKSSMLDNIDMSESEFTAKQQIGVK